MKLDTRTIVIIAIVALILYKYWCKGKEHFEIKVPAGPNCEPQHNLCANIYGDQTPDYHGCMRLRGCEHDLSQHNPAFV
jgi:hypothetical protein